KHFTQLLIKSKPYSVKCASGWYCTPNIGNDLCAKAIISPLLATSTASNVEGSFVNSKEWYLVTLNDKGKPAKMGCLFVCVTFDILPWTGWVPLTKVAPKYSPIA